METTRQHETVAPFVMSICVNFHDKWLAIVPDIWRIGADGPVVRCQNLSRHNSVTPMASKKIRLFFAR
jgi:hypothetical protein